MLLSLTALLYATIFGHVTIIIQQFFYNSPPDVSNVALISSAAVRHRLWLRDDHHPTIFFTIRRQMSVLLLSFCSAAVRHHLWSRDDHHPTIFLQFAARCLYCLQRCCTPPSLVT
jgi:hypothetical protein